MRHGWLAVAVALLAVVAAGVAFAAFWSDPRPLWDGVGHDRNHHYAGAVRLAADLREGRPLPFLRELERFRLWPPLHGLLASVPLAVGDLDRRLAVLPSLAGWVLAVVCVFLAARRAAPAAGSAGAAIGAAFALGSPAHRALATDVMLESLGGGLTMACLYLAVRVHETREPRVAGWLGLALSALLLEKYNYYILAVAGLVAGAVLAHPGAVASLAAQARSAARWPRHPLAWLAIALVVGGLGVAFTGGGRLAWSGGRISMTSPDPFFQLALVAGLARAGLAWRHGLRERFAALDPVWQQLLRWHGIPAAVWLVLPRRLGYLLHHVGPWNAPERDWSASGTWERYASALGGDYHASLLCLGLAVVLAVVALLRLPRSGPGARSVAGFVLVAALLTISHPNQQSRFLHPWIGGLWVLSGLGAAALLAQLPLRRLPLAAAASLTAVLALQIPGWLAPPPARAAPTILQLSDWYASRVAPSARVAFACTMPAEDFGDWSLIERTRDPSRVRSFVPARSRAPAERRALFERWLADAPTDVLVTVDVPPGSPWHVPGYPLYDELRGWMAEQTRFTRVEEQRFDGATVSLWVPAG